MTANKFDEPFDVAYMLSEMPIILTSSRSITLGGR